MWLSGEIERGTNGQRERNSSDSISSLSICINRPLFDAGGRQPSTNRRTEVKLKKKKKRMVFFQKNIPPEINNNNYNYSKKNTHTHISYFLQKQPLCCSSETALTIQRNTKPASWRFVLADMKVIELCGMILRRKTERQKEAFMNIEASSKL